MPCAATALATAPYVLASQGSISLIRNVALAAAVGCAFLVGAWMSYVLIPGPGWPEGAQVLAGGGIGPLFSPVYAPRPGAAGLLTVGARMLV